MTLNPCGLVANTFFNDKFTLVSGKDDQGDDLIMIEEGIAWQSDVEHNFKMPNGFLMNECTMDHCLNTSTPNCCQDYGYSCDVPEISKKDGLCYAYDYPEANTTRYLYQ